MGHSAFTTADHRRSVVPGYLAQSSANRRPDKREYERAYSGGRRDKRCHDNAISTACHRRLSRVNKRLDATCDFRLQEDQMIRRNTILLGVGTILLVLLAASMTTQSTPTLAKPALQS